MLIPNCVLLKCSANLYPYPNSINNTFNFIVPLFFAFFSSFQCQTRSINIQEFINWFITPINKNGLAHTIIIPMMILLIKISYSNRYELSDLLRDKKKSHNKHSRFLYEFCLNRFVTCCDQPHHNFFTKKQNAAHICATKMCVRYASYAPICLPSGLATSNNTRSTGAIHVL